MKLLGDFDKQIIALVATSVEGRYSLRDFHLDVGASRLYATDGKKAMSIPVAVEVGETSGLVQRRAIRRLAEESSRLPKMFCSSEAVKLEFPDGESVSWVREDGQFPNIHAVIPVRYGPPTVTLDAKILADIMLAIGYGSGHVDLWIGGREEPVLIAPAAYNPGTYGCLMPCRSSKLVSPTEPPAPPVEATEAQA